MKDQRGERTGGGGEKGIGGFIWHSITERDFSFPYHERGLLVMGVENESMMVLQPSKLRPF